MLDTERKEYLRNHLKNAIIAFNNNDYKSCKMFVNNFKRETDNLVEFT